MKTVEESVVIAMDGSDTGLFPFLPYILQDMWEIGADPETIIRLIRKSFSDFAALRLLDLGCGKGAVSVMVSQQLGCSCHGIDAIPEFVAFAQQKAVEFNVDHLCTFETGDIREMIKDQTGYDIILLGAIGPVFGDYYATLTSLSGCLAENGIFIIDDGYIADDSHYNHPLMLKFSALMEQVTMAGMEIVENEIMDSENIKESDRYIFDHLKRRCVELIEKFPDKQELFLNYMAKQEIENDVLETKVIGTTMVIRKKNR
jgi:cyclopropane fatty-acyl-phospholipid synthase-like methyltransferase